MTDPSRRYETSDEATGIPRWVKLAGIVAAVVVLVVVVLMLVGGGEGHRPRRHGGNDGNTPPASVTASHLPPRSGHG
jgi:hypothetical protein